MRYKIIVTFIATVLLFFVVGLVKQLAQSKQNFNRLEESFAVSNQQVLSYKTLNGKQAAKIQVLQLRNSELQIIYPEILAEVRNLRIKPRLVNHYSETVIHHKKEVVTLLKDSLVFDTIVNQVFNYADEFYSVKGKLQKDSIYFDINSTDSLIQVVYRGKRKRPWLWVFSGRELEQAIYSKNPHSTIIYSKTISITK